MIERGGAQKRSVWMRGGRNAALGVHSLQELPLKESLLKSPAKGPGATALSHVP